MLLLLPFFPTNTSPSTLFINILIIINLFSISVHSIYKSPFGITRDYCLHESFNATCKQPNKQAIQHFSNYYYNNNTKLPTARTSPNNLSTNYLGNTNDEIQLKSVLLLKSAEYGRMRLGRCIGGDFNTGCSMSVTYYVDSQCSGKESCDMSVRNLVDIHPCQRDFMSYLEASYSCIDVHVAKDSSKRCLRSNSLTLNASPSGKILHESFVTSHHVIGENHVTDSEECPWKIVAQPGQRIKLKILVIGDESIIPGNKEEFMRCSDVIVVKETGNRRLQLNACDGISRERSLYISNSSELSFHVVTSRDSMDDVSDDVAVSDQSKENSQDGEGDLRKKRPTQKFIFTYEAQGCKDLEIPNGAWIRRSPDNVVVKCNHSLVTWYLTCQANKWIGLVGNCSGPVAKSQYPDSEHRFGGVSMFPTLGILLAVLLGIGLGIVIGMVLLLFVHCLRKKAICNGNKQGYPGLVRRKGSTPDPNYHHPFPNQAPHMYGCISLIDNPSNTEPYHPLTSSALPSEAGVAFPALTAGGGVESESGILLKNSAFSSTPISMQHYNSAADNRSLRKYNSQPRQHHHHQQQQAQQQQNSHLTYDECCPTCIAHDRNNEHNINRINNLMQQQQQQNNINESILYPIALRNPEGSYTLNKASSNNNNATTTNNNNINNVDNKHYRDEKICVV